MDRCRYRGVTTIADLVDHDLTPSAQVGSGSVAAEALALAGQRDKRPSQREVLVAPQLSDGLDAKDFGEHLVVAFSETGQRRWRSGEDLGQTLFFVRLVQHIAQLEGHCHDLLLRG